VLSFSNVSAEIFVVCQDFKAPSRIDPKFLDPRHVFKDLDPSSSISGPELVLDPLTGEMVPVNKPNVPSNSKASANVFEPQKTRRHRDGYEDGDYIMFKTINVEEFFKSHDAISVLGTYNTINFDGKEGKRIRKLEITSDDIKENCKDLKVLGKKDFRNLLKWRKLLREEAGLEVVPKVKGEGALNSNTEGGENVEVTQDEPLNSDDEARELDEEIERLGDLESKKKRKERRKRNELKQKLVMKLQLKMGTPLDIGMDMMDETREASGDVKDMFSLKKRRDALALKEKSESNEDEDDDGLLEEDQQKLEKQFQLAQDNPDIDFEVESEEEEDDDEEEDEEAKKVRKLEKSMDDLYDDYRSRVSERDAKFRVRAAKLADKSSKWEEWGGIKEKKRGGDDDEDGEAGEGEDGEDGNESEEDHGEIAARGYDEVMKMKEGEETLDTDDEEDEKEEEEDRLIRLENKARLNRKRKDREEELQRQSENDGKKQKVNRKGLVVDLENEKDKEIRASRDALIWFDNPLFKGIGKALEAVDDEEEEEEEESEDESESGEEEVESDEELGEEEVSDDDSFEIVPPEGLEFADDDELPEWDYDDLDTEEAKNRDIAGEYRQRFKDIGQRRTGRREQDCLLGSPFFQFFPPSLSLYLSLDNGLTTAEAITLAQQLVNREATKSSLIDSGFSKQNFVDKSDLPSWFLDDEQKHWKANTPITKEAVQALRARVKALDARPIKKIAEAKARKKMRTVRRLEKAMKKADTMNEAEDVSEREKSSNINKVLLKAAGNKPSKKNEKTLVVARGPNRGIKGRPKGAKGRYRMVDRRMKKEIRANSEFEVLFVEILLNVY